MTTLQASSQLESFTRFPCPSCLRARAAIRPCKISFAALGRMLGRARQPVLCSRGYRASVSDTRAKHPDIASAFASSCGGRVAHPGNAPSDNSPFPQNIERVFPKRSQAIDEAVRIYAGSTPKGSEGSQQNQRIKKSFVALSSCTTSRRSVIFEARAHCVAMSTQAQRTGFDGFANSRPGASYFSTGRCNLLARWSRHFLRNSRSLRSNLVSSSLTARMKTVREVLVVRVGAGMLVS
jgi:hypothetical protein